MKQGGQNGMELLNVNADFMQMFVIISNLRMKINVDVNAKN